MSHEMLHKMSHKCRTRCTLEVFARSVRSKCSLEVFARSVRSKCSFETLARQRTEYHSANYIYRIHSRELNELDRKTTTHENGTHNCVHCARTCAHTR